MNCPDCRQKMQVTRTVQTMKRVVRTQECECGSVFETEESISGRVRYAATGSTPVARGRHTRGSPVSAGNPPVLTGSAGGVGGGLSEDRSGSGPEIDQGPRSQSGQDLIPSIARPPARMARVAAITVPFLDVFDRYPRQHRKSAAAQAWQERAENYPGGEIAMSKDILAAFNGGFLKRPAYANPDPTKILTFENFIAESCWQDKEDKPTVDPADPYSGVRRTGARGGG